MSLKSGVTLKTGGAVIVDQLVRQAVPYAFGVCGHANIGLLDALYDARDRVRTISVHHEQAAGHMADAYFRLTHEPCAVFASSGPGSTNLPVALASAMMDSSALLAITGNVPTSHFNRGAFQETYRYFQADFPSVLRPYVKRSFQPTRPEQLPAVMRQALRIMCDGRPGPVHVDVPLDLFVEQVECDEADDAILGPPVCRGGADPDRVRAAVAMLLEARRPVLLAGGGVVLSEAEAQVQALAERLGIPVVSTPLGAGVLRDGHPLDYGRVGRNGTFAGNEATRGADVVFALGVRFDDRVSSGWIHGYTFKIPPTRLIQVDVDPDEIGRNYPVAIGLLGDVKTVLGQVHAQLGTGDIRPATDRGWLAALDGARRTWQADRAPLRETDGVPLHPERLLASLGATLPEDAVVLADVGVHHNWLVQSWPVRRRRSFLQSWGFGSMGFGVCGVLGAHLAAPDRPCVAVCGDGGMLMTPHAVATAVEYHIPAIWVVWNNGGYLSIHDLQVAAFGPRELATRFLDGDSGEEIRYDFAAIARAMGADGYRVERVGDLGDAVTSAIRSGRPSVIDVPVRADVRPAGTGGWQLPPLAPFAPSYAPGAAQ